MHTSRDSLVSSTWSFPPLFTQFLLLQIFTLLFYIKFFQRLSHFLYTTFLPTFLATFYSHVFLFPFFYPISFVPLLLPQYCCPNFLVTCFNRLLKSNFFACFIDTLKKKKTCLVLFRFFLT